MEGLERGGDSVIKGIKALTLLNLSLSIVFLFSDKSYDHGCWLEKFVFWLWIVYPTVLPVIPFLNLNVKIHNHNTLDAFNERF